MRQQEQVVYLRGWRTVPDGRLAPASISEANQYTVEYSGQCGQSGEINCGSNLHLAATVVGALRRAYEAGAKDKLAELRAFIGVDK